MVVNINMHNDFSENFNKKIDKENIIYAGRLAGVLKREV